MFTKEHLKEADAKIATLKQADSYAAKVFVQQLHISVDDLQRDELIVLVLYRAAEVQAGVPATH